MEGSESRGRLKLEPLLGSIALLLLLVGCAIVLRPFVSALMWAIVLAFSMNPLQRLFTKWFRGSRTLAACLVTLTVTVVLTGPIVLIGFSLAEDAKTLAAATRKGFDELPDKTPKWMAEMPFLGDELNGYWEAFAEGRKPWLDKVDKAAQEDPPRAKIVSEVDGEPVAVDQIVPANATATVAVTQDDKASMELTVMLGRLIAWARVWLLKLGGIIFQGVTEVLFSAFLAFFLLRDGPILSARLRVAVDRLAPGRGRHLLGVARGTVRGVVYGILGTALVQALVAGIGFGIAGVPGAVLLGFLTFFFAVVPFGPPIIWVPATLWLFGQGETGWGIFMIFWGMFGISGVDNILRPILISQGTKMPFVLIFVGVIGGALGFGLVGLFLGPTLLAVAFRLIEEWSAVPAPAEAEVEVEYSELLVTSELHMVEPSAKPLHHGGGSIGAG